MTTVQSPETAVFMEGWDAAAAGKDEDANPYKDGDFKAVVWKTGWLDYHQGESEEE